MTKAEINQEIYNAANERGMNYLKECKPTPMAVGSETSPFSGKLDTSKPVEIVEGGACGFASIIIANGRCSFARWVTKNKIGGKHYYGGTEIPARVGGQSLERKEAYVSGFCEVLLKNGIDCYMHSRLD